MSASNPNSQVYLAYLKPRSSSYHMIPEDWQTKISSVPGVHILGSSPRQLRFEADEESVAEVIKRVRAHCEVKTADA